MKIIEILKVIWPWTEIVPPKVNPDKLKRPTKHTHESLHRDHPHTTVGGRGIIARLRRKKK